MKSKGLKRLIIFIVFLIPVAWYLILQLFGTNNFSLSLKQELSNECGAYNEITIVSISDTLTVVETNYMNRVKFGAEKRSAILSYKDQSFFDCIGTPEADLALVSEKGLWGTYQFSRDGVDELLTELDILKLQQTYGKGTSR
ncbi:hypothetical protein [Ekhidna sp.]|uniref:hypothetical protein n=1 Tax=Ekhidna sp. TaxID=2608089 RepID=UPI0032EFF844